MPSGSHDALHEAGLPITHGYFVNSGLASVLNVMADGKSVEVGLAGKEGFIGLPLVVGLSTSPNWVVAQVAGSAFRIRASDFAQALRRCPQLERQLNRFTHAMAMQATQVAACNRLHEVEERLARCTLMSQDRLGGDRVPLTQEFLARACSVRDGQASQLPLAFCKKQDSSNTREEVNVESRAGLENAACECCSRWCAKPEVEK